MCLVRQKANQGVFLQTFIFKSHIIAGSPGLGPGQPSVAPERPYLPRYTPPKTAPKTADSLPRPKSLYADYAWLTRSEIEQILSPAFGEIDANEQLLKDLKDSGRGVMTRVKVTDEVTQNREKKRATPWGQIEMLFNA